MNKYYWIKLVGSDLNKGLNECNMPRDNKIGSRYTIRLEII